MELIYEFIEADTSDEAFAWFNRFAQTIYSLEPFPERGMAVPANKELRQVFFGRKTGPYRIIYATDKRRGVVSVLHIRHSSRATEGDSSRQKKDRSEFPSR